MILSILQADDRYKCCRRWREGKNSQVMEEALTFWCNILVLTPWGDTQNDVFRGIRYTRWNWESQMERAKARKIHEAWMKPRSFNSSHCKLTFPQVRGRLITSIFFSLFLFWCYSPWILFYIAVKEMLYFHVKEVKMIALRHDSMGKKKNFTNNKMW